MYLCSCLDSNCTGVDPNRNFPVNFDYPDRGNNGNEIESAGHCNRDDYGGRRPFSEAETKAVRRELWRQRRRMGGFISIHCCAASVVHPANASRSAISAARAAASAMNKHEKGRKIRHGTVNRLFGGSFGGGVLQWASSQVTEMSFVLEGAGFRGQKWGLERFLVEEDRVEAASRAEQVLTGLEALLEHISYSSDKV